jgi:hypothetical protein
MAVAGDASSVAVAGALAEPLTEVLVPVSLPLVPFLTVVHTRSFREARGRLSFGRFCSVQQHGNPALPKKELSLPFRLSVRM